MGKLPEDIKVNFFETISENLLFNKQQVET